MRQVALYRVWTVLAVLLVLGTGCRTLPVTRQSRHTWTWRAPTECAGRSYEYLLYLPPGYADPAHAQTRWPLLVYLPGLFSSGWGKRNPVRGGPPLQIEEGRDLPMVVATIMRPAFSERWSPHVVADLTDHVKRTCSIDPSRVYLAGDSFGGVAVWDTLQACPERYAAAVTVAAWGTPWGIRRAASVPVWGFHGERDFVVPCAGHARILRAHQAAGGCSTFTVLPGAGHMIWDDVYARDEVYRWLLAQRKSPAVYVR